MFAIVYHLCFAIVFVGSSLSIANTSRIVNGLDLNIHAKTNRVCSLGIDKLGVGYDKIGSMWDQIWNDCLVHCQFKLAGLINDNGTVIIPRVRYTFAHDVIASCNKNLSLVVDKCKAANQIYHCVRSGIRNKAINLLNTHAKTCARDQHDNGTYTYNYFYVDIFKDSALGFVVPSVVWNKCNLMCALRKMGVVNGTNYPSFRKIELRSPLKGMHVLRYEIIYRDCHQEFTRDHTEGSCVRDFLAFCCFVTKAEEWFQKLYGKIAHPRNLEVIATDFYEHVSALKQDKVYIPWKSQ